MTLKESYQNAYARKNQAVSERYKVKKAALTSKKKRLEEEGSEKLRAAYGEYMRSAATLDQQNRSAGRFGGAAENQKAGLTASHAGEREQIRSEVSADVAAVETQIKNAAADRDKKLSDNATALQQKLDAIALKEEAAAQKSGKGSSSGSGGGSTGKVSKSQAITLMKMGIYDASFAGLLGISDKDVRDYVEAVKKGKKKTSVQSGESTEGTRLPGTYKPPLE